VTAFPLGPQLERIAVDHLLHRERWNLILPVVLGVVACVLALRGRRQAAAVVVAAVLTGGLLVGEVSVAGGDASAAGHCSDPAELHYLGTLPKSAIIAGDPTTIGCVTIVSKRPVVISRKLYQVFSPTYLQVARQRMFAMVDAYFGPSRAKILGLRSRYGADYLVVQPDELRAKHASPRWKRMAPFTGLVTKELQTGKHRAALELPAACRTFHDETAEVYDLACVAQHS
jgi:hypothetical protein